MAPRLAATSTIVSVRTMTKALQPSAFQRFLLPGFAFKAIVIGGGYATGRELAEFFVPSGPWGGVAAIALSTVLWSIVCAITFVFAWRAQAFDYRLFFKAMLGKGWVVFEVAYILLVVLVLSVFGAAAGSLGAAMFGIAPTWGTLALMVLIAAFVGLGNTAVERLFSYVTFMMYGVYAIFAVLALSRFGDDILVSFGNSIPPRQWVEGGLKYSGYNVVCAVAVLAVLRHLTSSRDALIAGLLAGPLAMLPALIFFVCMMAFYPGIGNEALPSDFMLRRLDVPAFHILFQIMIFAAILESGAGTVHSINERVSNVWSSRRGTELSHGARFGVGIVLLTLCMFIADRFGLVTLISEGYGALSYVFLAIYVLPVLTIGLWRILRSPHLSDQVSIER